MDDAFRQAVPDPDAGSLLLYGCASSDNSTSNSEPAPAPPAVGQRGTITVEFPDQQGKVTGRRVSVTGFGSSFQVLYGPLSRPGQRTVVLTDVPVQVVHLLIGVYRNGLPADIVLAPVDLSSDRWTIVDRG